VSSALAYPLDAEWLEADGLGGFASGTVGGIRTRRYHALLLTATTPPTGRVVLINGLEVWLETPSGRYALSAQRYAPDVVHPDGHERVADFRPEPWPRWRFRPEEGMEIGHELVACRDRPEVVLRWRLIDRGQPAKLVVRPLLSGRDYHGLHRENPGFSFDPEIAGGAVVWRPYRGLPAVAALTNGAYRHEPLWYRSFLYEAERERGLDCVEDLASPGSFTFDLAGGRDAVLILRANGAHDGERPCAAASPEAYARQVLAAERQRRGRLTSPLHRAAEMYVVRRGTGRTIVAGYPWFTDWGRDTFIALRGLSTMPGGLELARDILLAWADTVSEGMLPNRFPDSGEAPEYNSVDASLWYVVAVHDFLRAARRLSPMLAAAVEPTLRGAVDRILRGYRAGTRFGIRMDEGDGLLAAGVPGAQLTWMDAKIGDWVVTPRIGKPVEIQALWLNALRIGRAGSPREWGDLFTRALASFQLRFWNEARGCLHDVVDVDHVPGRVDGSIRPNQILAVGGLPFQALVEPYATRVVEAVERHLLTPLGLRSLAPGEPGYRPRYGGGVWDRDSAYHQGPVWPWLMGPFVEAWLRVRGATAEAKREAGARFVAPLLDHLNTAGIGHVSEIADAEPPYRPGGCPFQAWSLGELLRVSRLIEVDEAAEATDRTPIEFIMAGAAD
jgi:predicted glycogen debranching enzyme